MFFTWHPSALLFLVGVAAEQAVVCHIRDRHKFCTRLEIKPKHDQSPSCHPQYGWYWSSSTGYRNIASRLVLQVDVEIP